MTLLSHTTKPERQVPQWAIKLPQKMPTAVYGQTTEDGTHVPGLYDLMVAHPDKCGEISDRLMQEAGDKAEAMSLYEEAEAEAKRTMHIDALRAEVYTAVHEIRQQALRAEAAIARLESGDVYDVEVAEGADVSYVKSYLSDVRRAGFAAYAIWPFDQNGDVK